MLSNYIKMAWRSLRLHQRFTLINILGLSLALLIVIYYLLYRQHQLSFDTFHEDQDRIYRVLQQFQHPQEGRLTTTVTPGALGSAMAEIPDIEHTVAITLFGQSTMTIEDPIDNTSTSYNERAYLITNSHFFDIFTYPHLSGNPQTSLAEPNQVVLTKAAAEKYFGNYTDAIGRKVTNNRTGELTVSGIVDNPPKNSHIHFDFLISSATFLVSERGRQFFDSWEESNFGYYIKTKRTLSPDREKNLLSQIRPPIQNISEITPYFIQPIGEVHFSSAEIQNEMPASQQSKGNPLYLKIFSWITLLVVLVASINYINLATARAIARSKEISVRKVIGASRTALFSQLIIESLLTTCLAGLVAYALALLLHPMAAALLDFPISSHEILTLKFTATLLLLLSLLGVMAGLLPALILSAIQPLQGMQAKISKKLSADFIRKALTTLQFGIAVIIVSATLFATLQLRFLQNKDLGFEEDHLITIDINSGKARSEFRSFKDNFLQHPDVNQVTATSRVPGEWKQIPRVGVKTGASQTDSVIVPFLAFDEDALETFSIELTAGRNFTGDFALDSTSILVNKTAVDHLGLSEPLGAELFIQGFSHAVRVIGVVEDFHLFSLHETITPVVIAGWRNPVQSIDYFTCRFNGYNVPDLLEHIESVQATLDPTTPLEFHFLDDQLDRFYQQESKIAQILVLVAILALIIASLGLFGLVTYMLDKRTKEIAVRKILGARPKQLWYALTKGIFGMLAIGFLVSLPLCWYFVSNWLENFAYTIKINPLVFAAVGLLMIGLVLVTIHRQLRQTLRIDPAECLRE